MEDVEQEEPLLFRTSITQAILLQQRVTVHVLPVQPLLTAVLPMDVSPVHILRLLQLQRVVRTSTTTDRGEVLQHNKAVHLLTITTGTTQPLHVAAVSLIQTQTTAPTILPSRHPEAVHLMVVAEVADHSEVAAVVADRTVAAEPDTDFLA